MQTIRNHRAFGANIRRLRNAARMTQEQVAAQLQLRGYDVSRSVYSQMECGIHNVRVDELIALRQIFGVSYEDFFAPIEAGLNALSDL